MILRPSCIVLMVLISLNCLYCAVSVFIQAPPITLVSPQKPKKWNGEDMDDTIVIARRMYALEFWIGIFIIVFLGHICPP